MTAKPKRATFDKAIVGVAWTGDGKHLAFSSPRNEKPELWALAVNRKSDPGRLGLTDSEVADLAISRDGKHAVYPHSLDDQNIWSVSLHSQRLSEPRPLVASTRRDTQPRYSPDGKRIAFESDRSLGVKRFDFVMPMALTPSANVLRKRMGRRPQVVSGRRKNCLCSQRRWKLDIS